MSKVKVGLLGAGPWAHSFHTPMIAKGPKTELSGIWARRSEVAEELAAAHGTRAVGNLEELIVNVTGEGDPTRWFLLTAEHESGAISSASLSLTVPTNGEVTGIRLFTEQGEMAVDFVGKDGDPLALGNIRAQFAETVRAHRSHELDIHRALRIQRLLDQAARSAS